jgi:FMN-dependent oxidoreductase (nitrilotriacetate monooxygenase family)
VSADESPGGSAGRTRTIKFGLMYHGVGTGQDQNNTWRNPRVPDDASINIQRFIEWARKAEAAKLDFIFIADTPFVAPDAPPHYLDRLEPLTLLSALAVTTSHIGLVGTLSTSYNSPYNLARRVASLDLISGGRAGWNVVATGDAGAAQNFGREEHFGYGERYPRALEHVQVVQGLWDSYEDDAFPKDADSGVFHRPEKQHRLDHHGEHFRVAGPIAIRRSPQGQPVIFQAGNPSEGRDLGATIGEGIFCHLDSLPKAQEFSADIRGRATQRGRDADQVLVLPGISIVIEDTDAAALKRQSAINKNKDFDKELAQFGRAFAWHDFGQYDLDAPFPDVADLALTGHRSSAERIVAVASERGFSLRETVLTSPTPPTRSPDHRRPWPTGSRSGSSSAARTVSSCRPTSAPMTSTGSRRRSCRCSRPGGCSGPTTRARPCAATSGSPFRPTGMRMRPPRWNRRPLTATSRTSDAARVPAGRPAPAGSVEVLPERALRGSGDELGELPDRFGRVGQLGDGHPQQVGCGFGDERF